MTMYTVTNPATGQQLATYPVATDPQVRQTLNTAATAFDHWKHAPAESRARLLHAVADLHEQRRGALAVTMVREMGKPIRQARGEIDIVVSIYRYYADNGPQWLQDEELAVGRGRALVRKQGLGVLLGIMPWNYPFYQVARFVAPNVMNGNAIILKHAPQCPESALAIEQIFKDAGAHDGVYNNVFASNEQVADMIASPVVAGVSLTGSERAGSAVARLAGQHLKKVVLELGGSDPFLVLDDADLAQAVENAVNGRFDNAGQACNAAKRIIVHEQVYDAFVEQLSQAVKQIRVGDPLEEGTAMGPLSSQAARDNVAAQVDDALGKGATLLAGGEPVPDDGAWYRPTLLADVTADMRAYTEEIFGPVAIVYKAADDAQALALANASAYGLGASVQTADADRAARMAAQLDTGMVFVNEPGGTAAELPFGGVKRSGFGRELGSYGMDEFVNRKLIKLA